MKSLYILCLSTLFLQKIWAQTEIEPNNTCIEANTAKVGEIFSGNFHIISDRDFYKITIPRSGYYKLAIDFIDPNSILQIRMSKDDCTQTKWGFKSKIGNMLTEYSLIFYEGGEYILDVSIQNSVFTNSGYNIILSNDPEDPYEENNSIGHSAEIFLNQSIVATFNGININPKLSNNNYDSEFFKVKIERKGILVFEIEEIEPNIDISVSLFNSDSSAFACICCGDTITFPKFGEILACDTGYYYISFRPCDWNTLGKTKIKFNFSFLEDTTECNEVKESATYLVNNQQVFGSIGAYGLGDYDVDYYRFTTDKICVFNVNEFTYDENADLKIILHHPDGKTTEYYKYDKNLYSNKEIILCEDTDYYLEITTRHSSCSPKLNIYFYSFILDLSDVDKNECNNNFETAPLIFPNQNYLCSKDVAKNDLEYFKFSVTNSDSLTFQFYNVDENHPIEFSLFSPNKNRIKSSIIYGPLSTISYKHGKYNADLFAKIEYLDSGDDKQYFNFIYENSNLTKNFDNHIFPITVYYKAHSRVLKVESKDPISKLACRIYDLFGRLVYENSFLNFNETEILFDNPISSLYFLVLDMGNQNQVERIYIPE